ncbi:MAG: phage protein GemA/Gp16 family protein [Patescibacteria group bacterium]|jgi:hypothetical protein
MRRIDPKQIQLIHIAKEQRGLSDVEYRDLIAGQTKGQKTSSKDLTYIEADAVINYFVKTLGFKIVGRDRRSRRKYAHAANVVAMPSRDQLDLIDNLKVQIKWQLQDGFQRWLAKYIKTDRVRTAAQAQRAIEGLKGMIKNQIPSPLRGEGQGEGDHAE